MNIPMSVFSRLSGQNTTQRTKGEGRRAKGQVREQCCPRHLTEAFDDWISRETASCAKDSSVFWPLALVARPIVSETKDCSVQNGILPRERTVSRGMEQRGGRARPFRPRC